MPADLEDLLPHVTPEAVDIIAFDLDDTLAPSKTRLPQRIADVLTFLLDHVPLAVISGGNETQFREQVIAALPAHANLANLHLLPTCGTRYLRHVNGVWTPLYAIELADTQRATAMSVLRREAEHLGLWEPDPWGEIIEDRGSQITFSALGQQAPLDAKKAWDPTGEKKARLRDAVAAHLPDLEVRSGGSTSVDITLRGIDKAYGMRKLSEATRISLERMLFIGDRLDPDGNDYPVLALGVQTYAVRGWEDTAEFLEQFASALADNG